MLEHGEPGKYMCNPIQKPQNMILKIKCVSKRKQKEIKMFLHQNTRRINIWENRKSTNYACSRRVTEHI